ncbi:MAG: zinc-dependent metalloprotease [Actinomycetota bacterium]
MSDVPQMGPGFPNPFGFDLSQLMRWLQSPGPVNLDVAREVAKAIATADATTGARAEEAPIDDTVARAFDNVVRAAQTAVANTTGISGALRVPTHCVNRREWSDATLEGLAPVLTALATALATTPAADDTDQSAGADAMLAMVMQSILPLLLGVFAGAMVGQLSHRALGQYDLPLPLDSEPTLRFVAHNVEAFADEWSLPLDELQYALALRETVHGAQRSIPWIRARLVTFASDFVGAYEAQSSAIEEQLAGLDFTNPEAMQNLDGMPDAGALLGAMRSDRQVPLLAELQRFVSVLEGYADVVVEQLGTEMIPAHARIDEAIRRHRVERGDAGAFVDALLGLELEREHYERGVAFCRGVIERAGMDGLNRLWEGAHLLPTQPELEAPGLWLARIEL